MTITFIPEDRKQKYLLIALGVILLTGLGVVWYRFFWQTPSVFIETQPPAPQQVSIDFSVFDKPAFLELGNPRPPIVRPDEVGKRNPFAQ